MPGIRSYSRTSRTNRGSFNRNTPNSYNNYSSSSSSSYGSGSATNWTSGTTTRRGYPTTQFKSVQKNIQQWIGSFRNINTQFSGPGKCTAFSPTTVNRWIKYINGGCFVYKFTNNDFCRNFGTRFNSPTSSNAATRFLRQRFGTGIRDVTRGKGNCWLIAATSNVTARPFSNYKW